MLTGGRWCAVSVAVCGDVLLWGGTDDSIVGNDSQGETLAHAHSTPK